MNHWRRFAYAVGALGAVLVAGVVGYVILGFGLLDAAYQTVTTVSTVGFREVEELDAAGQLFTIVLILVGVGTTLYALGVLIETIIEGRITDLMGRRRMQRSIEQLENHVIVCGWGRSGRSISEDLAGAGAPHVVVELDERRAATCEAALVVGDATDDAILRRAGIERASSLICALDNDAANLFVTVSARALNAELFIVSRVRSDDNEPKLLAAGADRVVNPHSIGGARMAAMVLQPNVAAFVDVVMHERDLEYRLGEVPVVECSPLAGSTLRDAEIRERSGALVLARRGLDGEFVTNPEAGHRIEVGDILIAIGTADQLRELGALARPVR